MKVTGRIAHAYLLTGDEEALLEGAARHWGRTVACTDHRNGRPCGECPACRAFGKNRYREWYELRPQSRSRRILVDEMRAFEHQLSLTPAAGWRKIGLVAEADRMNDQAQNAFLKTLEEPPGNLVLILLATSPTGLLPTIRSRCQQISFRGNRKIFDILESVDPLSALAKLKRGNGAAAALQAAVELRQAFGTLLRLAESREPDMAPDLEAMASQDTALDKRLQAQRNARIQSEYVRLRNQLCAVVESWFQQRCLLAAGIDPEQLPYPELVDRGITKCPVDLIRAQQDAAEAAKLSRCLAGNVDEALAVEAFCLTICRKQAGPVVAGTQSKPRQAHGRKP